MKSVHGLYLNLKEILNFISVSSFELYQEIQDVLFSCLVNLSRRYGANFIPNYFSTMVFLTTFTVVPLKPGAIVYTTNLQ
jgi:hypothetical protein